jgi:hypothetical protein
VLRLCAAGGRFRNVEEHVLRWRDHGGRLSRIHPRYAQDAFVRCKVEHLDAALIGDGPVTVWGAAGADPRARRRAGPPGRRRFRRSCVTRIPDSA